MFFGDLSDVKFQYLGFGIDHPKVKFQCLVLFGIYQKLNFNICVSLGDLSDVKFQYLGFGIDQPKVKFQYLGFGIYRKLNSNVLCYLGFIRG